MAACNGMEGKHSLMFWRQLELNAKLSRAERVFKCKGCDLVIDRDVNAAKNLLPLAVTGRGSVEPTEG
jgi:transposase